MLVRLVLWDLDGSISIEELREYLRDESVDNFSKVEGLRLKMWVSDRDHNLWGAVYLWDSRHAAQQPLPGKAREMIGKAPVVDQLFDLEATTEGISEIADLSRLGLAFE